MGKSATANTARAIEHEQTARLDAIRVAWLQDHAIDGPEFAPAASDATFVATLASLAPAGTAIIGTGHDLASQAYELLEQFKGNATIESAMEQHGIGFRPTPELGINPHSVKWSRERIEQALARNSVANSVLVKLAKVAPDELSENRTAWVTALSGNIELLREIARRVRENNQVTYRIGYIASKVSMTSNSADALVLASMAFDGLNLPEEATAAMYAEIFNVATQQYRTRTVKRLTRRLETLATASSTPTTVESMTALSNEIAHVLAAPAPFAPVSMLIEVPATVAE
jgi:hypothetical protein